jgi:peptidoglycan/LPS O-acetylase OafA/YrhL
VVAGGLAGSVVCRESSGFQLEFWAGKFHYGAPGRWRAGASTGLRDYLDGVSKSWRRGADSFRADIQGLRAVSVLLVALNHAGVSALSGGYVGVDVFFVISGFLITGWLLRRTDQYGVVPFRKFYAARARRILPAASLAIILISLASYHWLNYVRALGVFRDAVWSAFFAANIRFSEIGTDYFARNAPPSPLQHFWTLAVEEQFYIVWPALMAAAIFIVPGRGEAEGVGRAARRRIVAVLGVIIVVSLTFSIHETSDNQVAAYFSTLARAWEFGIGALLAVMVGSANSVPSPLRGMAGWVGLGGIVVAAVTFTSSTPFPGYAAALPVMSAALVIAAGVGHAPGWSVGRVIGRQPLRLIGDVSFGFYLWHWPFLIIPMEYLGHPLGLGTNLGLLSLAFGVSLLTYFLFENPIRYSLALQSPMVALRLWPATVLAVVVVAELGMGHIYAGLQPARTFLPAPAVTHTANTYNLKARKHRKEQTDGTRDPYVKAVRTSVTPAREKQGVPSNLIPAPVDLAADEFNLGTSCSAGFGSGTSSAMCRMGDLSAHRTLVVFGDSHAQMWMPALLAFARAYHWTLVPVVKQGCTAIVWSRAASVEKGPCKHWFMWAMHKIADLRPAATVLATSYSGDAGNGDPTAIHLSAVGVNTAMRALWRRTQKLVVLEDIPYPGRDPVDCLLANGATLRSCTFAENPAYTDNLDPQVAQEAELYGVAFMPTLQWFCANKQCPMVIGHIIAYADGAHISTTYATQLRAAFSAELAAEIKG